MTQTSYDKSIMKYKGKIDLTITNGPNEQRLQGSVYDVEMVYDPAAEAFRVTLLLRKNVKHESRAKVAEG